MSDTGKPPIFTTREEYNAEVKELAAFRREFANLNVQLLNYQQQFTAAQAEASRAQAQYNARYAENRTLARNARYWDDRISLFKGVQASNATYRFWQERSQDPRLSATERYISRETARRLKPARGQEEGRIESLLVLAQAREQYWRSEQEKVIAQINAQRDNVHYLNNVALELRSDIRRTDAFIFLKNADITDAQDQISRKVFKNLMVALHKRWYYESSRGPGHNISIEGIATVVVDPADKKEDHEDELQEALANKLRNTVGFERLSHLDEEVLGFEATYTDEKQRGVVVDEFVWEHKIVTGQLRITDYIKSGEEAE